MKTIASPTACFPINTPAPFTAIMLFILVTFAMIGIASVQNRMFTPDHGGYTPCVGKPANWSLPELPRFLLFRTL